VKEFLYDPLRKEIRTRSIELIKEKQQNGPEVKM